MLGAVDHHHVESESGADESAERRPLEGFGTEPLGGIKDGLCATSESAPRATRGGLDPSCLTTTSYWLASWRCSHLVYSEVRGSSHCHTTSVQLGESETGRDEHVAEPS